MGYSGRLLKEAYMKLGVISQNLMQFEFEEGLQYAQNLGLNAVEVGALGLWGRGYCNVEKLVADPGEIRRWLDAFARYELEISALGGHGAPLMPDKAVTDKYSQEFRQTCKLMEMAGLRRMTTLAGLPEGAEGDKSPNWVTFADLPFLHETLQWQWEQRLLPYWREHGKIAADHGVTLCFEMHGGDLIHNPVTLMRFREEIGPVVACNLDVSHLWFQGIDPVEAVRFLGDAIQHVHAKDTHIHPHNLCLRGYHDSSSATQNDQRPWTFTIPGWGHDATEWRAFVTALRLADYDHVLSIEMECEYINVEEGLEKSVEFLKPIVLEKPPGAKWWEIAGMSDAGSLY
jgi:sugar phosphate isomerase/epimerase